jgi:agmatine deiminase
LRLSKRRSLNALLSLTSGACLPSMAAKSPNSKDERFRLVADFEQTRAIWLGFNDGHASLATALVQALQPKVRVKMLVASLEQAKIATDLFQSKGIRLDNFEFFQEPLSNYFVRDTLIFTSGTGGGLGLIDNPWSFYGTPGWCQKRYSFDFGEAQRCTATSLNARNELGIAIAKRTGAQRLQTELVMEGGGLEVNGKGLLIANQALATQRNPGSSLKTLEQLHLSLPGVKKIIWLSNGLAEDPLQRSTILGDYVAWGTGGHTDEFVRFANENTVLLAWPDVAEAFNHPIAGLNLQRMRSNLNILNRSTDTLGRPLKIIKVPMPKIIERPVLLSSAPQNGYSEEWTADYFPANENRRVGDRVIQVASASYLNFVKANGVVVLPDYQPHGTSSGRQNQVKKIFETVFKGSQIRFVDAISANWVGGGPHCATAHEPY